MRCDRLAALALCLAPVPADAQDAPSGMTAAPAVAAHTVPAGTAIAVVTTQELTSKRHRKGDLVTLAVAEDVTLAEKVVIPAGTPVVAQITDAQTSGLMGQGGRLQARVLYLELPSGPVRLSGTLAAAGKSNMSAATAATALVSGFAFMISGKSAVIPAGTHQSAVLDRNLVLR